MNAVQLRMARGALSWTMRQLAAASDVPVHEIHAFLSGRSASSTAIKRVQAAFETRGVLFLPEEGEGDIGVRLRKPGVHIDSSKPSGPATDVIERREAEIAADREKRKT